LGEILQFDFFLAGSGFAATSLAAYGLVDLTELSVCQICQPLFGGWFEIEQEVTEGTEFR
jgi:hypothetical protein